MAQLLAQAGAQPRARDSDGWEPLHYASFNGHLGTAEWLLQARVRTLLQTWAQMLVQTWEKTWGPAQR